MVRGRHLFTSESVTEGHPDKIADQISDGVLDAIIAQDPVARVACETLVTTGLAIIAGEITTSCYVDFQKIVRQVIKDVGYTRAKYGFDYETCSVLSSIHEQSRDIGQGVDTGGAGDQGLMFGYACTETAELMPLPIMLAHKLVRGLSEARREGVLDYLRPDGKSQVTVEYDGAKPVRVDAVVLSTQHSPTVTHDTIQRRPDRAHHQRRHPRRDDGQEHEDLREPDRPIRGRRAAWRRRRDRTQDHRRHVRRRGARTAAARSPEKIRRRSIGPRATWRATSPRTSSRPGIADRALVQLAYAIGVADPVSVLVDTSGTARVADEKIVELVRAHFQLTPRGIIESLDLRKPIYRKTAAFGHFGRTEPEFTWERTDKAAALRAAAGL